MVSVGQLHPMTERIASRETMHQSGQLPRKRLGLPEPGGRVANMPQSCSGRRTCSGGPAPWRACVHIGGARPAAVFNAGDTRQSGVEASVDWQSSQARGCARPNAWSDACFVCERIYRNIACLWPPSTSIACRCARTGSTGCSWKRSFTRASLIWVDYASTVKASCYARSASAPDWASARRLLLRRGALAVRWRPPRLLIPKQLHACAFRDRSSPISSLPGHMRRHLLRRLPVGEPWLGGGWHRPDPRPDSRRYRLHAAPSRDGCWQLKKLPLRYPLGNPACLPVHPVWQDDEAVRGIGRTALLNRPALHQREQRPGEPVGQRRRVARHQDRGAGPYAHRAGGTPPFARIAGRLRGFSTCGRNRPPSPTFNAQPEGGHHMASAVFGIGCARA